MDRGPCRADAVGDAAALKEVAPIEGVGPEGVRRSELIAAVSLAADLGMGVPLESGLAACLVAGELARRLGADPMTQQRAYHLALLQHVGCTASAPVASAAFGDELVMRGHAATLDFADRRAMAGFLFAHVARTTPVYARPQAILRAAYFAPQMLASAAEVCEAARMLAGRFGYDAEHLEDLDCVYEAWDGNGFPGRRRGEDITLPARIVYAATLATSADREGGIEAAADLVRAAAGHRLDPAVAAALLADPERIFAVIDTEESLWTRVIAAEPESPGLVGDAEIDETLRAVADFVDLKAPCLAGHSAGVAALAGEAARRVGLPAEQVVAVRRAGWLHDIGRIGVSSGVWSREKLRPHDWEQVRLHPYYTERVLSRTPFLRQLVPIAAAHHEHLDGSGYHRGSTAAQLSMPARILAAADAYHGWLEYRPHRPPFTASEAKSRLLGEVAAGRVDGAAAGAVLEAAGEPARRGRAAGPAGLTPREVETLQLVARGLTIRQIARAMTIAPKTADGNIQRVYAKIGASTRAGATLFAMRHDLVPAIGNGENSP